MHEVEVDSADFGVGKLAHEQSDGVARPGDAAFKGRDESGRGGILDLGLLVDDLGGEASLVAQPGLLDTFGAGDKGAAHDIELRGERYEIEVGRSGLGD